MLKKNDYNINQTEKAINNIIEFVEKVNQSRVDERITILKYLNIVSETLEADSALKATIQTMAETNTTTSGNITSLTELLRNEKLPDIMTQLNVFQTSINSLSSQCASISESLKEYLEFNQRLLKSVEGRRKGIARDTDYSPLKLVIALREAHIKKQVRMEKATQEARLTELSKPELIKVVEEVVGEVRINPKALYNSKGGKEFLKQQDAEYKVLQREHLEKLKKSRELKKKRSDQYEWTTQNRLKPKKITNILIHPNTRRVTIIVYSNNDLRNFDVHKNFKLDDFGVSE
uniref:Uncharacterized protein n=1 Tax=Tanacetum cinerariifolium TaxID=118510 RepID=A0A6L2LPE3_TANCI|nr:hypothetical protein [Tanacetum cinerariifolium]